MTTFFWKALRNITTFLKTKRLETIRGNRIADRLIKFKCIIFFPGHFSDKLFNLFTKRNGQKEQKVFNLAM